MTNDIVALIEYYEREKQLERQHVVSALEFAFVSAYRKMVPGGDRINTIRAEINLKKGNTTIYASLRVVEDTEIDDKFNEVPISLARKKKIDVQADEEVEFNVTPKNFDRIAVQTAKQTMLQRLRLAEKEMLYEEYKDKAGELVSGLIKRFEKSDVMVDLGKFEGRIPQGERVVTEDYNIGDRIRCYVVEVRNDHRGPEIILSRSHPNFVRRILESEVTEIADKTVEIHSIAREAGYRTKISVHTEDSHIDPVGACVGMRGARVKNIVRELNNEKVDIVRWNENLEEFVTEALKPCRILSVEIIKDDNTLNITVDEEDLSKAVGRRGQNARLTSRLIGWNVQIKKSETQKEKFEARINNASSLLASQLGVTDEIADHLYRAGGVTPEMISQMPLDYIASTLENIDGADASEILDKASSLQN